MHPIMYFWLHYHVNPDFFYDDILKKFGLGEMLHSERNAQGGSTPAAVAPPTAINPEQVLPHRHSAPGRYEGTGTIPSFVVPVHCISYYGKRNSPEPKFCNYTESKKATLSLFRVMDPVYRFIALWESPQRRG
jgi:hypothetical protein